MGATEDRRAELLSKLGALALEKTGNENDWPGLFAAYDADKDGSITRREARKMLTDADVGAFYERGHWVEGLFVTLDKDHDDNITRAEIEAYLVAHKLKPEQRAEGRTISDAQAAEVAIRLRQKGAKVDVSQLSQADLEAIEEASVKLGRLEAESLGTKPNPVPPIPARPDYLYPLNQTPKGPTKPASKSGGEGGLFLALGFVGLAVVLKGRRR
jgi:Ca2+-binding EF-hand superfamily protein